MVPELSCLDKVHGISVALRSSVSIVKMGRCPGQCESDFALAYLGQRVIPAYKNRLTITRMIGRARSNAVKTPGPTPGVIRRVRMVHPTALCLTNLVEFLWQKLGIALVGLRIGRRLEVRDRLFDGHHIQGCHKWPRGRARPRNEIR